jgi:hypothetical protein
MEKVFEKLDKLPIQVADCLKTTQIKNGSNLSQSEFRAFNVVKMLSNVWTQHSGLIASATSSMYVDNYIENVSLLMNQKKDGKEAKLFEVQNIQPLSFEMLEGIIENEPKLVGVCLEKEFSLEATLLMKHKIQGISGKADKVLTFQEIPIGVFEDKRPSAYTLNSPKYLAQICFEIEAVSARIGKFLGRQACVAGFLSSGQDWIFVLRFFDNNGNVQWRMSEPIQFGNADAIKGMMIEFINIMSKLIYLIREKLESEVIRDNFTSLSLDKKRDDDDDNNDDRSKYMDKENSRTSILKTSSGALGQSFTSNSKDKSSNSGKQINKGTRRAFQDISSNLTAINLHNHNKWMQYQEYGINY